MMKDAVKGGTYWQTNTDNYRDKRGPIVMIAVHAGGRVFAMEGQDRNLVVICNAVLHQGKPRESCKHQCPHFGPPPQAATAAHARAELQLPEDHGAKGRVHSRVTNPLS